MDDTDGHETHGLEKPNEINKFLERNLSAPNPAIRGIAEE